MVENLWEVGGLLLNPAGGTHSAPDPLAGGEGACCPSPRTPPGLRKFGLDWFWPPMKNAGRALVGDLVRMIFARIEVGFVSSEVTRAACH